MIIDPRYGFYLSMALGILAFLGGAGAQFADLGLDPHTVKALMAGDLLLLGIGNVVNTVLVGAPSTRPANADDAKKFPLGPKV